MTEFFDSVHVDEFIMGAGIASRAPVRAATTGPVTIPTDIEAGDTIDGVTLVAGDRLLVKDQVAGVENGVYIVQAAASPALRSPDFDDTGDVIVAGIEINVIEGTVNGDTTWRFTNVGGSDIIGTDALSLANVTGSVNLTGVGVDNRVVRFDGTDGQVQVSGATIDDNNIMTGLIRSDTVVKDVDLSGTTPTGYTILAIDNDIIKFTTTAVAGEDTVILPDAMTLPVGWTIHIVNVPTSVERLNINDDGGSTLHVVDIGGHTIMRMVDGNTSDGVWDIDVFKPENIVHVAKSGGDFTSINDALASIIDNSILNRYVVQVGPGIFTETPITLKEYVNVVGEGLSTVVSTSAVGNTAVTMESNSALLLLVVTGATSGTGILIDGESSIAVRACGINNCATGIDIKSTTAGVSVSDVRFASVVINGTFTTGVHIDATLATSGGGAPNDIAVTWLAGMVDNTAGLVNAFEIEGPGADVFIVGPHVAGPSPAAGNGLTIEDGATVRVTGMSAGNMTTAVEVPAVGDPPNINLANVVVHDNTDDILISHASTTGVITGVYERSKVTIPASSTISITYTDPVVNGAIISGDLYLANRHADLSQVTDLITGEPALGRVIGGAITEAAGALDVDVTGGFGYVHSGNFTAMDHKLFRAEWSAVASFTLDDDTTNYIYVTSGGVVSKSPTIPDIRSNVLLGRVQTLDGDIIFIDASPLNMYHAPTANLEFSRSVVGARAESGMVLTSNASRNALVTSGKYWFSNIRFSPSGLDTSAADTFSTIHTGGSFTVTTGVTAFPLSYDASGTLTALVAGEFAKHSFYIVGDGTNEKYFMVYSQDKYASLVAAQNGAIPTAPGFFEDGVMLLATVVVEFDDATFTEIIDLRPTFNTFVTGGASVTDHGALAGLGDDDHVQYLLVNGTRAMTGDLDMGTNAITNVGLVDGVDVSAHAARHLPTGLDALATAAPVTTITTSTANLEGTANSFARSDHVHAFDETTIDHTNIQNIGTNTHAQIDTHIASTANPHSVTIDQITPTTTKGDIMVEDGTNVVRLGVGTNGQTLVADSATTEGIRWGVGELHYDAIVDSSGAGDYTLPSAAFAGGATTVFVRDGTYSEVADVDIPDGGVLVGESIGEVIIDFGSGLFSVKCDPAGNRYDTGTISITTGSSTVTSTGATFTGNVSPGDYVLLGKVYHEIDAVAATTLTLTHAYQGEGITAASYIAQTMFSGIHIENITIQNSGVSTPYLELVAVRYGNINNVVCDHNTGLSNDICTITDCGELNIVNVSVLNLPSGGGKGFLVTNCYSTKFDGCIARNNAADNFEISGGEGILINKCTFANSNANGFCILGDGSDIIISGSVFDGNDNSGINVISAGSSNIKVADCFFNNNDSGVVLAGSNNNVTGCIISNSAGLGISLNSLYSSVVGNTIHSNASHGISVGASGCTVAGNNLYQNTGDGIRVLGTALRTVINSNVVYDNGADGIFLQGVCDEAVIVGNMCYSNTGDGIDIDNSDRCVVSGNRCTTNTGFGLSIDGSSADTTVLSNNFQNNTGGTIDDSGTISALEGILINSIDSRTPTGAALVIGAGSTTDSIDLARTGVITTVKGPPQFDERYLYLTNTADISGIVGTFVDLTWDTQNRLDAVVYTHTGGTAGVTFDIAGDYKVTLDYAMDIDGGSGSRTIGRGRLQLDTGGGFATIADAEAFSYHRTSTRAKDSASISIILTVAATDVIKAQVARDSGGATLKTLSEGTRLLIEKI